MDPFKIQCLSCQIRVVSDIFNIGMNKLAGHSHYHINVDSQSGTDLIVDCELTINVSTNIPTNFYP